VKFRKDNPIWYCQDHTCLKGIPAGVDFAVEQFGGVGMYILRACGYGCQAKHTKDCYGNGALCVYTSSLTQRQRKRFQQAAQAAGGKP